MSEESSAKENKSDRQWAVVLAISGIFLAELAFYNALPTIGYLSYSLVFVLLMREIWLCKEKEDRLKLVLAWAFIGGFGGWYFVYMMETSSSGLFHTIKAEYERLIAPIFLLIVSAPLSLYLWSCRNEDKLKQIRQTDEQNSLNRLSNAMQFLLEKGNKHANAAGLKILAKIKSESKAFDLEIDMTTSGVDLGKVDLTNAKLIKLNLSRAILTEAKLPNTDLTDANLTGASMLNVDLTGANLKNTTLDNLVLGIDKKDIYKKTYDNKFSREAIEDFLKKDWKEHKTDIYAQMKRKEKNKEIHYYFEAVANPSPSPSMPVAPPPIPVAPPPIPVAPPPTLVTPPSRLFSPLPMHIASPAAPVAPPITPTTQTEKDAKAYFDQGKAKLESNDLDGAIKDFDKALELDANHAGAYRLRALAKLRKGMK